MNRTTLTLSLCFALAGSLTAGAWAPAGEWMTYRSTYTHDQFGQRVDQHTRPVEPLSPDQGNMVRSGYRNYRSTIQGSTSADNLHITHEWGRPVMPYEHWRFPYRPFGAPYDQWGPPVPNVLSNFNFQGAPYAPLNGGQFPGGANGNGFYPPTMPGYPGSGYPGSGYPGSGFPGSGFPGSGFPGSGFPGSGFPGGFPGSGFPGYPNRTPSAPWIDGLYPSAPPLR